MLVSLGPYLALHIAERWGHFSKILLKKMMGKSTCNKKVLLGSERKTTLFIYIQSNQVKSKAGINRGPACPIIKNTKLFSNSYSLRVSYS